jgi:hypothetical protein
MMYGNVQISHKQLRICQKPFPTHNRTYSGYLSNPGSPDFSLKDEEIFCRKKTTCFTDYHGITCPIRQNSLRILYTCIVAQIYNSFLP